MASATELLTGSWLSGISTILLELLGVTVSLDVSGPAVSLEFVGETASLELLAICESEDSGGMI